MEPGDTFQFTTSQGGRRQSANSYIKALIFQFTTSQGGRPYLPHFLEFEKSFNSRPHKEVDLYVCAEDGSHVLSIHDLTRRSTPPFQEKSQVKTLSIHDLTRRSTCLCEFRFRRDDILSIHDLTRRSTVSLHSTAARLSPFNSRPHKEVDSSCFDIRCGYTFQFTTSQGGRLRVPVLKSSGFTFQFTTSQGGRQN